MWMILAILSAVFAALTSILAKVGIDGVNSNLATALRTCVVLAMAWGMVFLTDAQGGIGEISRKSWIFLVLSGLATGASWLCYYKALQLGEASKVVPIDKLILNGLTVSVVFLLIRTVCVWSVAHHLSAKVVSRTMRYGSSPDIISGIIRSIKFRELSSLESSVKPHLNTPLRGLHRGS